MINFLSLFSIDVLIGYCCWTVKMNEFIAQYSYKNLCLKGSPTHMCDDYVKVLYNWVRMKAVDFVKELVGEPPRTTPTWKWDALVITSSKN